MRDTPSKPVRRGLMRGAALIGVAALAAPVRAAEPAPGLDGNGMPYAAFDRLPFETVEVDGGRIRVACGPGDFELPRERIIEYVRQSARSVAVYFGRFPASRLRLLVLHTSRPGRPIRSGTTFGYGGAAIKLTLAASATASDLEQDWILVHEMSHVALPSLPRRQHWFEEGMATYVEPLARAQAGRLSIERVWGDMVRGLLRGLPEAGDEGLDHTPTWGRTYWGGALFCLLADVETREATAGRSSLQQALRAILAHANIEHESALEPLLQIGDAATGVPVLAGLYARMKDAPYPVDLGRLWSRLGVRASAGGIEFDDGAPLAALRQALTRRL